MAAADAPPQPGSQQGTDDDGHVDGRRQVDAHAHGQHWQAHVHALFAAQQHVHDDQGHTDAYAGEDVAPLQVVAEDAVGDGGHQRGLRGGQRLTGVHAFTRHGAGEAIGLVEHFQHRGDDQRTDHAADDQRHLLPPGGGMHQPARLQILQVVVGDRGHRNDGRTGEEGQRNHELAVGFVGEQVGGFANHQQHQRDDDNRDDADARDGAGR